MPMNTSNKAPLYGLIMGSLNVDCRWSILKSLKQPIEFFILFYFIIKNNFF